MSTTHQVRRVWKDPEDPRGKRDIHGPWFDCPTCPPATAPPPSIGDVLALAAAYDQLCEAADRLCVEIEKRVPFDPGPWNAYWALRYLLDGKNSDGSDPQETP